MNTQDEKAQMESCSTRRHSPQPLHVLGMCRFCTVCQRMYVLYEPRQQKAEILWLPVHSRSQRGNSSLSHPLEQRGGATGGGVDPNKSSSKGKKRDFQGMLFLLGGGEKTAEWGGHKERNKGKVFNEDGGRRKQQPKRAARRLRGLCF